MSTLPSDLLGVEARYHPQTVRAYQGNPFIETLGPMLEPRDVAARLRQRLPFSEADRALPDRERIALIDLVQSLYEPLPESVELFERLDRLIRAGYVFRNPVEPTFNRETNQRAAALGNQVARGRQQPSPRARPMGLAVIGRSGVGKTTAIETTLANIPQLYVHTRYKGEEMPRKQVVWLKVESPTDGSLKTLILHLLGQLDDAAASTHVHDLTRSTTTVARLLPSIGNTCAQMGLGLLVVDEVQHLDLGRKSSEKKLLNFFVQLANTVRVPVVLVGTPQALPMLTREFRQGRRVSTFGDFVWSPMANDRVFANFAERLWKYQWVRTPVPLDSELLQTLHYHSQGVTAVVVSLFMLAQKRAIETKQEQISPAILDSVAGDSLRLIGRTLSAVRNNNERVLKRLADIQLEGAAGELIPVKSPTRLSHGKKNGGASKATTSNGRSQGTRGKAQTNALDIAELAQLGVEAPVSEVLLSVADLMKSRPDFVPHDELSRRRHLLNLSSVYALAREPGENGA